MLYSYNRSQQDSLFLNLILVKNSTCFGQTYCPSSGVLIMYSQQLVFYIHGSVHRESNLITVQKDATVFSLLHFYRQLYMFRLLTPIVRSWYSCNYSFSLVNRVYYHPLNLSSWNPTTRADVGRL